MTIVGWNKEFERLQAARARLNESMDAADATTACQEIFYSLRKLADIGTELMLTAINARRKPRQH